MDIHKQRGNSKTVRLSKTLSWILRHGADKVGIVLDKDGYANVKDILDLPQIKKIGATSEIIEQVVANCPKQRFSLRRTEDQYLIRANQGHSLEVDLDLEKLSKESSIKIAYHGTYYKAWDKIKTSGLSRMGRQHIHLAPTYPLTRTEASTIRGNCQTIIEVDVQKLLEDGFDVYKSVNNVILTSGDKNGFVPTKYFIKVTDRKTGEIIFPK